MSEIDPKRDLDTHKTMPTTALYVTGSVIS
jgi:hypothetical protein